MSTSISQVIAEGGFNLTTKEDAEWLIAQVPQFEALVTLAEDLLEAIEDQELAKSEAQYQLTFAKEA